MVQESEILYFKTFGSDALIAMMVRDLNIGTDVEMMKYQVNMWILVD